MALGHPYVIGDKETQVDNGVKSYNCRGGSCFQLVYKHYETIIFFSQRMVSYYCYQIVHPKLKGSRYCIKKMAQNRDPALIATVDLLDMTECSFVEPRLTDWDDLWYSNKTKIPQMLLGLLLLDTFVKNARELFLAHSQETMISKVNHGEVKVRLTSQILHLCQGGSLSH
ncbi:hypothetical protein BY458DRAFT_491146 [Sporodiniella umbellata]|nr:hypothetical protein BY458DRAFT_491146 [Sporodiniella umbellata]